MEAKEDNIGNLEQVKEKGKAIAESVKDLSINGDAQQEVNCEGSFKATQEEGWETPKRRHTCRAKGTNQVSTMQVVHNQENEDHQGSCNKDTGQNHSSPCLKGVELGLGLDSPN
ncbi:hypothetical protein FRX31_005359 [Thalictrum thalictroides]|uniref:Uncharacterized protein n=1 Tax=Thalictrum thalictroides TaxID=46969 RepID=A0A7J6X5T9_THATH|nr:hypothetical protein FRX31_005359 [Thalictrum thalictroides]